MIQEIRLPKCLTQLEQNLMRKYIDEVCSRFEVPPPYKNIHDIRWIFLAHKRYNKRYKRETRCFYPFAEFYPYCFNQFIEGSLNYALEKTLKDVLTVSFTEQPWEEGDILCFFCRAYAMAIHSLNHRAPEYDYGMFSDLWKDESLIERIKGALPFQMSLTDYDKKQCVLICACMVYCILEREKEPNVERLLHHIQLRLESSKSGINLETLERFRQAVAEIIEAETETPTDEQNTAEPTPPTLGETNADSEYEGEQTYYDTLSEEERDEKIKKAITKLKENGYLKQKDQYLGIFKVLVNRGVCTNNLSEFCRYMVILGFAKERTHGAATKRKTNDIYEVVKKVPSSFRDQRLSEWLSSREEQDAKFQKITDTAKRFYELIPSHKK